MPTPYHTARLSRSEFSYSFPVTNDPKFIRLYFYLISYNPNFLRSDAFFSIKAGSHTLLKGLNASLNADASLSLNFGEPKGAIVREYCVNIGDSSKWLMKTFRRSSSHPNAYAFVNGIEVVSMPDSLYHANPDNLEGMMLEGRNRQFPITNSHALETMYRINVGGSSIPSFRDTGMFRYWDEDNACLKSGEPNYSVSVGFGLRHDYKDYPNYTASDAVHLTTQNNGMKEKSKFNVTWEFQVNSQFVYMVRLYFCEFDLHIEKVGEFFRSS